MKNNIKFTKKIDIIKYPIITDKSTQLLEENQYSFAVDKQANKKEIKQAIEYIFDVKIKQINTCNKHAKKKRIGKFIGKKAKYKKAIITLHNNYNINLFPEN
nr:ribosomal protein L23 [Calliblepharis sp.]